MNTKTLLVVYCALFHCHLNYGIIAWGGDHGNNLNIIQVIQDKIIKIIYKNKFPSSNPPLQVKQLFQYKSLL